MLAMMFLHTSNESLDEPWEQCHQLRRYLTPYTIALCMEYDVRQAAIDIVIRRDNLTVERLVEAHMAYDFAMVEYNAACTPLCAYLGRGRSTYYPGDSQ